MATTPPAPPPVIFAPGKARFQCLRHQFITGLRAQAALSIGGMGLTEDLADLLQTAVRSVPRFFLKQCPDHLHTQIFFDGVASCGAYRVLLVAIDGGEWIDVLGIASEIHVR